MVGLCQFYQLICIFELQKLAGGPGSCRHGSYQSRIARWTYYWAHGMVRLGEIRTSRVRFVRYAAPNFGINFWIIPWASTISHDEGCLGPKRLTMLLQLPHQSSRSSLKNPEVLLCELLVCLPKVRTLPRYLLLYNTHRTRKQRVHTEYNTFAGKFACLRVQ